MNFLIKIIKDFPSYLWSGWGAIASILLFLAFWDLGNQIYGNLIYFKLCIIFNALFNRVIAHTAPLLVAGQN